MQKSVISIVLTQLIRYLLTLECLHPPINRGNLITVIHIWKNVVLAIFDMPFTMRPNMSAIGIQRLLNTLQRNEQKASITMLLYLMPSKNWFESFMQWKSQGRCTTKHLNSFLQISPFLSVENDTLFVMQFSMFKYI